MVSSIVPGATSAGALGVDPRLNRAQTGAAQTRDSARPGDTVALSSAALASTRDSVRAGIAQVQATLSLGADAQSMLVQAQALARGGGGQADLDALLQGYAQRADATIGRGVVLAAGQDLDVQAEPGAAGVTIGGVDLRLKSNPGASSILGVSADAQITDPALADTAQKSLETLQGAMNRLIDSSRSLEAHQGFLSAVDGSNVRTDLDADSARLLALQVRQGLQGGTGSIANVEPQAVLALFKA